MNKLLIFYKYCFYRFYKTSNEAPFPIWSDLRAMGLLMIPMILLYYNVLLCFYLVTGIKAFSLEAGIVFCIVIGVLNLILFASKDKSKSIISIFDSLPEKVQRRKKWFFRLFLLSDVGLFVLFLYLAYLKRIM